MKNISLYLTQMVKQLGVTALICDTGCKIFVELVVSQLSRGGVCRGFELGFSSYLCYVGPILDDRLKKKIMKR